MGKEEIYYGYIIDIGKHYYDATFLRDQFQPMNLHAKIKKLNEGQKALLEKGRKVLLNVTEGKLYFYDNENKLI